MVTLGVVPCLGKVLTKCKIDKKLPCAEFCVSNEKNMPFMLAI